MTRLSKIAPSSVLPQQTFELDSKKNVNSEKESQKKGRLSFETAQIKYLSCNYPSAFTRAARRDTFRDAVFL